MPNKKNYSLSELKELAKSHLKKHKIVFATTDGQFFPSENSANLHAKPNKLVVHKIEAAEADAAKKAAEADAAKKAAEADAAKKAAEADAAKKAAEVAAKKAAEVAAKKAADTKK